MRTILLYLFLTFIYVLGACENKIKTPLDLASTFFETYNSKSSLSYDIDYQISHFSDLDDTIKVTAKVDLIRMPEDTIFGGYIWLEFDSFVRYYDTEFLYLISHSNKSITRFPKEKTYVISGNTAGDAINVYFLKPKKIVNGVKNTENKKTSLAEDTLGDKAFWKLRYEYPDEEYFTNMWKNIWFDKDKFTINKINYSVDSQGENQYNQWDILNMLFDNIEINDLENRFSQLTEEYELRDFEETSDEEVELLVNGSLLPDITAMAYPDSCQIPLADYRSKVTLYDFWYMDCFPCIKAIPHLNQLHQKYKDKGLQVVGVNPYDNTEKNRSRLPNFLEKNNIEYPWVFINREDCDTFNIYAFPTVYLTDHTGTIFHSEVGFEENATGSLDSLIQSYL